MGNSGVNLWVIRPHPFVALLFISGLFHDAFTTSNIRYRMNGWRFGNDFTEDVVAYHRHFLGGPRKTKRKLQ
jgi:hypothetical protein